MSKGVKKIGFQKCEALEILGPCRPGVGCFRFLRGAITGELTSCIIVDMKFFMMNLVQFTIQDVTPSPLNVAKFFGENTHGVSAKTIQRILGHKAVSTTERSINNIIRDLKEVMT